MARTKKKHPGPHRKIKTTLLVHRQGTPRAKKLAQEVGVWLQDKGVRVYSHPQQSLSSKIAKWPKTKSFERADLVVVLGGDGTYLEAVRLLGGKKVPILGINLGSLGFLTETRVDDLYTALQLVLDNKLEMRPRSMLEVTVTRDGKQRFISTALNDVVIERGSRSHLINMGIYSERHLVSHLKADGMIIATPTGSTAYNLAAHGPILHPEVPAVVVTPICPHALTSRPMIFPDNQQLCFRLNDPKQKAFLTVDGQYRLEIKSTDDVLVSKASCDHFVLREPSHNYFDLLREKLKFGQRD